MDVINKLIICILASLCISACAFAQDEQMVQFGMHYGYQQENMHWSIAGNTSGTSPNVLSELKWMRNGGLAAGADLQFTLLKHLKIAAGFNRLQISSGRVTDMDYAEDNRSNRVYNGQFDSNKGYSTAYTTGLGYEVMLAPVLWVTPMLGYVISKQSLYLTDNSGQLAGLNSAYAARWRGPFAKLDAGVKLLPSLKAVASVRYSQVKYYAEADWNLIPDFVHPVSYRHTANGYGVDAGLKLILKLNTNTALTAGGTYFNWQTGTGTDALYLTNGTTAYTQMNGAFRHGYEISGGTVFSF